MFPPANVTALCDESQYCVCLCLKEARDGAAALRTHLEYITCPSDSGDASGTPALTALAGGTDRFGQISWSHVAGPGEILFDSVKYTFITFLHLEFHLTLIFETNHILLNELKCWICYYPDVEEKARSSIKLSQEP